MYGTTVAALTLNFDRAQALALTSGQAEDSELNNTENENEIEKSVASKCPDAETISDMGCPDELSSKNNITTINSLRKIVVPNEQALLTVQFFLSEDEEQPLNEQIVKNGDMLFKPGIPENKKEFLGWFEKGSGQPYVGFGVVAGVKQNRTLKLYAHFAQDTVHVFYHDQNGEVIRTDSFQPNQKITIEKFSPSVQVDPNTQNHIGWATKANSNQNVSGDMQLTDQDVNLYPITQEGYWITFDTQGGTTLDRQFIALTDQNKKIINKKTYKQGYTFDRWTTDNAGGTAWDFNQDVQKPMTLYAQWKPAESYYTVKYWLESPGPEGKPSLWLSKMRKATVDTTVSFNEATDALTQADLHAAIAGVTLDKERTEGEGPITIKPDGSSVMNIYYKRNVYNLTFKYKDDQGVEQAKTSKVAFYQRTDDAWSQIGDYAKYHNGWRWYSKELNLNIFDQNQLQVYNYTTDITFVRESVPQDNRFYTIFYEGLEGTFSPSLGNQGVSNEPIEKDGKIYFHTPQYNRNHIDSVWLRAGNGFVPYPDISDGNWVERDTGDGWLIYFYSNHPDLKGKTVKTKDGQPFNGDTMDLYYSRKSYQINFEENGGPEVTDITQGVPFEKLLASYEPKDYTVGKIYNVNGKEQKFAGWYLDEKFSVGPVDWVKGRMPAKPLNLYAKWQPITYTVTFDTKGGSEISAIENVAYGEKINKPEDPVYSDHIFLGWSLEGKPYSFESGIHENITLVAEWKPAKSYQVTYELNGGSGTVPNDPKKYYDTAKAVVLAPNNVTPPDGKVFLGWKFNDAIYYPGGVLPIKGDSTLIAQWGDKAKATQLTYDFNFDKYKIKDHGEKAATVNGIVNNAKIQLADFTSLREIPSGWRFTGWYLDKNVSGKPVTELRVDNKNEEENIVYAGWEKTNGTEPQPGNNTNLKPEGNKSPELTKITSLPKTGENNDMALCSQLLLLSGALLLAMGIRKRSISLKQF